MTPAKPPGRKRGRGRPPRLNEPATRQTMIRLGESEHDAVSSAAAREGQSLSAWVRDAIRMRLGL